MFNYLLAVATDAAKNNTYDWFIAAAALPPLLALFAKERKHSWLQRLLLKKIKSKKPGFLKKILLKRVARKGGKKMSDGLIVLLFILGLIGIGALIVWLLGWAWLGVIGLLALLLLAYGKKSPN